MVGGIELLENGNIIRGLRYPFKIEKVTQIVITAGGLSCIVDFRSYTLKAPAMAIFLPGQVVESLDVDEEFEGLGMVISSEFTDSLNLPVTLQERLFLKHTQFHAISQEAIDAYLSCYRQVAGIMKQDDNPYQEQIIKHLFSAYYYGLGYYVHSVTATAEAMTPQQDICDRFISLVAKHFKEERTIDFYADRLCVSKKYLSSLLKQHTGMTALMWIERYVVLYAKSSLSSINMTIQQLSDELNFPSQSVFGKYFKRVEGISPKAYRESLR
ncbi:MAG: helix-turn-helix transcriptional regulator [Alistipes sp.]|nr:helix-turn-helix transcriptional regulator [Alistipes sp.]